MKIDRASFLGLALTACNAPSVASGQIDIPRQPVQPPDSGASRAPEEKLRAPTRIAKKEEEEEPTDDPDEDSCGFVDASRVKRPSGACSDDQAPTFNCKAVTACGAADKFTQEKCEAYRKYMKPRVAKLAFDCLAKLDAKTACDACGTYRCGDRALKGACADVSTDAACLQIVSKCKSVPITECRLYLAGLNAAGRAKVVTCLTTGSGCGFGIYACTEGF